MSTISLKRRVARLLVALVLTFGVAATPAQLASHGTVVAQTHALQV